MFGDSWLSVNTSLMLWTTYPSSSLVNSPGVFIIASNPINAEEVELPVFKPTVKAPRTSSLKQSRGLSTSYEREMSTPSRGVKASHKARMMASKAARVAGRLELSAGSRKSWVRCGIVCEIV